VCMRKRDAGVSYFQSSESYFRWQLLRAARRLLNLK
jgi:hypothetical protein